MFNSDLGFQFGGSGLTPLPDDDDFLALLGNPKALPSATANPADLSVLRNNINLSPTSSESSPSPPNHTQSGGPTGPTAAGSGADLDSEQAANIHDIFSNIPSMASRATRSGNRDPLTGEPSAKRKTLDEDLDEDSDEDAPQRKFQHTDGSGNKKTATKRKSIGGQDDTRLQKRKEQNRAAQRAFRERKERHVKDLEDKVSMLEAKTDSQAAENENLRELLTRLQQENLQLKQNQFSFTFQQPIPSTSANPNRTQPYPAATRQTSSDTNMAGPKATPNSSSSSSQSPLNERSNSMSNGHLNGNASTPQLTNSSASPADFNLLETLGIGNSTPELNFSSAGGLTGLTPPSSNNNSFTLLDSSFFGSSTPSNTNNNNNGSDLSAFGDLGGFQPMPYQTIAASPMYTSYRDPTANPNAWSFGPNSSQSLALNTYDELFGGAGPASLSMSGLPSAGGDSAMASAMDDLMPFSFMPDLSNGTGGSQFGGLSPISHLPTPPSATTAVGASSTSTSGNVVTTPVQAQPSDIDMKMHDEKECPKTKEEMANIIQQMGSGTFGPPVDGATTDIAPEVNQAMADEPVCDKMRLADSTKLNLDIGTAWRAVRQHPQFEECDIDELCADLAKKATCDGNTKVIEAQKIMDLVHSIPERAKQRKLTMATRSLMA